MRTDPKCPNCGTVGVIWGGSSGLAVWYCTVCTRTIGGFPVTKADVMVAHGHDECPYCGNNLLEDKDV